MKRLTNVKIIKRSYCAYTINGKNHNAVIVAATRIPWTTTTTCCDDNLLEIPFHKYLPSFIVDNVIKQSNIDLKYIQTIYMLSQNIKQENQEGEKELHQEKGEKCSSPLTKATEYIKVEDNSGWNIENDCELFFKALSSLEINPNRAVIIGSVQTTKSSHNNHLQPFHNEEIESILQKFNISWKDYEIYVKSNREHFLKAQQEHLFDSELLAVTIKQKSTNKRLVPKLIKYDEFYGQNESSTEPKTGACALVITTNALALELNLKPLAKIQYYSCERNECDNKSSAKNIKNMTKGLLQNIDQFMRDIKHWETEDPFNILPLIITENLHVNINHVNPEGDIKMLCQAKQSNFLYKLTHLAHTLQHNELGSIIAYTPMHSAIVLIRNLFYSNSEAVLTLYTTKSCQLCNQMLDELEYHFHGLYKLYKVYIDCKENIRYLRLYRYDVPVLFLNGQFLCMHRLNVPLLRRKLQLLKQ